MPEKYNYIAYNKDGKLLFKTNTSCVKIIKENDEWIMVISHPESIYMIRKIKDLDGRELINDYKLDLNNMSIDGKLLNYKEAGLNIQKEN